MALRSATRKRRGYRMALAVILGAGVGVGGLGPVPAASGGTVSAVPRPDHVVVLVMENHSASSILGNPDAPYINSLAADGASMTQSFAITHPSQPNYIALFSGSLNGVTTNDCPNTLTADNLGSQLLNAGFTFGGYSESMPSVGYTGCFSGAYARKHNPWVNFPAIPAASNQPLTAFPADYSTLPTVSFVVPNLLNDMHDGSISQGDSWVRANFEAYVAWARAHNSILVLTFDEDDNNAGNRIPTIFVGAGVVPGQYPENITHYNVLRTLQDAYGLPPIANSAGAAPILDIWQPPAGAPRAAFTVSCADLSCTTDGSTSSGGGGSITSYSWNWGDGSSAGSGVTATHTYSGSGDFQATLTVRNDASLTDATTHPVAPRAAGDADLVASDSFQRTVTGGFGSADVGGPWAVSGTATRYGVSNGIGSLALPTAGTTSAASLLGASGTDLDIRASVATDKLANGNGTYIRLIGRHVSTNNEYLAMVRIPDTGVPAISVEAYKGTSTLVTLNSAPIVPGLTVSPGGVLRTRLQVTGTNPTVIRLKVWSPGAAEPMAWQSSATDSFAGLQAPGWIGAGAYLSSGSTNAPVTMRLSNLTVRTTTPVPPNTAPVARMSVTCVQLSCSADGRASSDSDGTVSGYSWNWGDGSAVGSGPTPSHPYTAPGMYPVVLTVTDNAGATGTTSGIANPTAPVNAPPNAAFTVSCSGLVCSVDAAASADSDGSVAGYDWDWGDGSTRASGVTAAHAYAAPGSFPITLTVTDNQGATGSVSHPTNPVAPADNAFDLDVFDRTVSGGWGSANLGGAWTTTGGATNFSVGGGTASVVVPKAGLTVAGYLLSRTSTSTDLTMAVATDKLAKNNGTYFTLVGRRVGANLEYQGRARVTGTGSVVISVGALAGTPTTVTFGGPITVPGLTIPAGGKLNTRTQVTGTTPTTIRLKVWAASAAEPASWQLTATDSTAALQAAGSVGLRAYVSSGSTNAPIVVRLANLAARPVTP